MIDDYKQKNHLPEIKIKKRFASPLEKLQNDSLMYPSRDAMAGKLNSQYHTTKRRKAYNYSQRTGEN